MSRLCTSQGGPGPTVLRARHVAGRCLPVWTHKRGSVIGGVLIDVPPGKVTCGIVT